MVEFNNEEMQGERRETFVIQADRFGEDSALNSVREKLRPLLKRGFAGFAEKRMTQCGTLNPYLYRASLVRATAILGGHLVWNQGEDWLVSEERQILLKETSLEGTAWLVALLYYMTMFETGAKLIIEAPEQGLNLNQQKMLSEMMVLYEAASSRSRNRIRRIFRSIRRKPCRRQIIVIDSHRMQMQERGSMMNLIKRSDSRNGWIF